MTVVMLKSDLNEFYFIFIDEKGYKTYWTSIMCCPAQKKIYIIFVRNEQDYLANYMKAEGRDAATTGW